MSEQPATRSRNRRGEGARLRDEIVAAAAGLIDETGDESAVTLRSVARRVGIAAPSIYRHFPDQPSIMLALVQQEFDGLAEQLRAALDAAGADPVERLFAGCNAYLQFAEDHPSRYRLMFGGVWMPALDDTSITESDLSTLGDASIELLTGMLSGCVTAGLATSTDLQADAIALWLGLHGLAHQRASTVSFPWPPDIAERMITALAHLK
ncbi:TetR/AcrR family transcriptional regulator [Actinocrispum sp. NPDC049592]|uniref:TetR/AcrR family transcriptional regulator n=1 Tax=Actinocrispum sp. NPDC049592 TaxID=3154835 RepID=UPI0034342A17